MKEIQNMIENLAAAQPEQTDYTGENGLLYCGKCHTPKQAYFPDGQTFGSLDRHPTDCDCRRKEREQEDTERKHREHLQTVDRLKDKGFTDRSMREWTFERDNGRNPQMKYARYYVEHFEDMKAENVGYLLWGSVGTGKSYLAGCIANALMEQEISVCMTNFAAILNDLKNGFDDKNAYISQLCRYPLLIIDDFGMERDTSYGLEQLYNVIDSRYRSRKPLIVTTNITLAEMQKPEDTAHSRIYDRLLEMCVPIAFHGESFRKETAQARLEKFKERLQ